MSIASMFAYKDRFELSIVVRRQIQLLLPDQGCSPSTRLMLIHLPALTVERTSKLFGCDPAMHFNHSSLHEADVIGGAERGKGAGWSAGGIGSEDDSGKRRVYLISRVTYRADTYDVLVSNPIM
jgi:hypothetical protein